MFLLGKPKRSIGYLPPTVPDLLPPFPRIQQLVIYELYIFIYGNISTSSLETGNREIFSNK